MKLKSIKQHEKWFPVPEEESAEVLIREKFDAGLGLEALTTKALFGLEIDHEIEQAYLSAIVEWKGVEAEDGTAAVCDIVNKKLFLRQPGMLKFVRESMRIVTEEGDEKRRDAEKNS